MRLGVISDTHNQRERTRRAMDLLVGAGAEAVIHCGDFTQPEIITLCAVLPLTFVLGNNDVDVIPELKQAAVECNAICLDWGGEVTLHGRRIAVTHGHRPGDVRRLLAAEPDWLLTGHSHVAGDHQAGRVRRINPGALHRAATFSVAVIDLATDTLQFLPVPR